MRETSINLKKETLKMVSISRLKERMGKGFFLIVGIASFSSCGGAEDVSAQPPLAHGVSAAKLGQSSEDIKDYDKPIELDSTNAWTFLNRGELKAQLGQHVEAIKDYDKAIELDPKYLWAFYRRGESKAKLGQHVEAIKDYDKAIELDPKFDWAFLNRAQSKANLGRALTWQQNTSAGGRQNAGKREASGGAFSPSQDIRRRWR